MSTSQSSEEHPSPTLQKGSAKKVRQFKTQMKCFYTNTRGISNKQEELTATAQLENYNLTTITKLVGINHMIEAFQLMAINCSEETDKEGKVEELSCMQKKRIDCTEPSLKNNNTQVFWVKNKDKGNCGWHLLQSTQSTRGCWWRVLASVPGSTKHARPWSCWVTSTTKTPAGKAAKQTTSHPGNYWCALRLTSSYRW